jgi:hypothetical protein
MDPYAVPAADGYDDDVKRALSILRGSDSAYITAWVAFFASLGLCVYGAQVSDMSDADRKFFGLAVLFMVSSSFTLAKTYRDRQLADLLKGEAAAGRESAAVDVLKGTDAWAFQVVASFVLAVGFSYHSLYMSVCEYREGYVCNGDLTGDAGFAICAASFVLITTLSLAKYVRDRADATILERVNFRDGQARYEKIMAVSRGSVGNAVVVVVGLVAAVVTTIGGAFSMSTDDLSIERKGFVLIAALFMMTSSFHLAKLVRDLGDPELAKNLNLAYRLLCVAAFAVAILIGIGGVQQMTIPEPKQRFLINGLLFILCSTIYVAKAVRDSAEAEKLERNRKERAMAPAPTWPAGPGGAGPRV